MKDDKLAVLIDADNVPYANIREMLVEIAKYGNPTIKRIYADWTKPSLSGWKNVLLENAITPIQQYSYTQGKNSSDSALIIDAMDLLYAKKVSGFCIVSSDSDFTRLATRLREAGMFVMGFGEKKTPKPFITACDKFIYIEILKKETPAPQSSSTKSKQKTKSESSSVNKIDKELTTLIRESIDEISDENGWAFLGTLGNYIIKKKTDFDPRNYGFPKLFPLIKHLNTFEISEKETGDNNIRHIYVKNK
ncbi:MULTISPECIES: NYN domain-containing protein [unclassified Leeuwenhoekiella]|uniref:NYN domain-containing protein n=1 Tax=unclassified Leeuwenhoekiella TaxID=2615029 RepID=UPI000C4224CB|nr:MULTISPECIES: NYN domain-containing protein [unclassified Leeuwenhoekiella]MAW96573.1 Maebl [Leeuwenhoekiella sp.]MBA81461.1 Maebl [Leeuwenhoekiella sp.]|tara:strand:+ start:421 stop:1167 length:747 start_codon:yes stop_codon:yes gene_type:complete